MTLEYVLPLLVLCCLHTCLCVPCSCDDKVKPKLLIILLDGFRWDYVIRQYHDLPGFARFYSDGSVAEWVKPLYPSVSFPSWTTLLTGLYAENHGILGNYMYDRPTGLQFVLDDTSTTIKPMWWTQEPIWITAKKQGLRTADIYLSRCEIVYDGVLPDYCIGWTTQTGTQNLRHHLNHAQKLFQEGYDLVLAYGQDVDAVGHSDGPDSPLLHQTVKEYDVIFSELFQNLTNSGLDKTVNIIVVSDHGMTYVGPNSGVKAVYLDDYVENLTGVLLTLDGFARLEIFAEDGQIDTLFEKIKYMPGITVYKAADIPDRFHLKRNPRVCDILAVASPGHTIEASRSNITYRGIHGYDNDFPDMRSVFFAKGPAFRQNYTLPAIKITDIYQVYSKVLNITPRPHNGTWNSVRSVFRYGEHTHLY